VLARRYRLSERQARRYVERARDEGALEVPRAKVVFSVKLPTALVGRVRRAARSTGRSLSDLVSQALTEFLDRHHGGGRG
jgi:DNA-binding transcriptional regulator LsrR (DeoR family)